MNKKITYRMMCGGENMFLKKSGAYDVQRAMCISRMIVQGA
jgi:hypothetical protein